MNDKRMTTLDLIYYLLDASNAAKDEGDDKGFDTLRHAAILYMQQLLPLTEEEAARYRAQLAKHGRPPRPDGDA